MTETHAEHVVCMLCGKETHAALGVRGGALRPTLTDYIREQHGPKWDPARHICAPCLDEARKGSVAADLERERGALSELTAEIARRAAAHDATAAHVEQQFESEQTFGQRIADKVASVGGSWPFVIVFVAVLLTWIGANTLLLRAQAYDPYPYILLNLILSCVAALQAPVIMMSQNRASARDRLQADEDFKINLKTELEVAMLHDKIDHLLHVQWERMIEVQQVQLELLEELTRRRSAPPPG